MTPTNKSHSNEDPRTAVDDVLDLMDSFMASASVCTAIVTGLFWRIGRNTLSGEEIAGMLGTPVMRCRYWLQHLCMLGLLDRSSKGFTTSRKARDAILDSFSRESWTLLAEETGEQTPVFYNLAAHFGEEGSVWEAAGLEPPRYIEQMMTDSARAVRFTRMLFELHAPLAEEIAGALDMSGVERLMDLGGGSGVMSTALLRRHHRLTATVVDIENVCAAGRAIAAEHAMQERLRFHPANFMHDALPAGFDMVLECDVGVFDEELFKKVKATLNPGGRFVVIDQLATASGTAPPARIAWAVRRSLINPDYSFPTAGGIESLLRSAGFQSVISRRMTTSRSAAMRFTGSTYIVEARA